MSQTNLTPQELSAQALLQKNTAIQKEMDRVYTDLVVSQPKGRLPEDIFVNHFLPFFSGKDSDGSKKKMGEWIGIAGNATAEVDIIDPTGEVLYTVPSMMNSNALDISNRKVGDTISEMVSNYKLREAHIPGTGQNYLNHESAQKVERMVHRENLPINQTEKRWLEIFNRYNLNPGNGSNGTANGTAANTVDPADDLEY